VVRLNRPPSVAREPQISAATILLLAAACGLIVADIYYAQPLIGPIADELGLAPQAAGLIVTMAQIGYGAGLVFVVPLGDLVENRRLVIVCVAFSAIALALAAVATSSAAFLVCSGAIGLGAVGVQILVPLAAHLAPDAIRGRVVGAVMSGLMVGIMVARPVASFIASQASWRAVFAVSAALMVALGVVLSQTLPVRTPESRMSYGALIGSMARLAAATPILRLRAFYQSCLFAAFSLFWTTTPLLLAGPDYRLTQRGIALFALAGVSGAVAAPIAGRLADRGYTGPATAGAICLAALGFLATMAVPQGSTLALALLVAAAIAIDFGVQANVVLGMRAIFALAPEARGRLNGVYIATFFAAGALGSAVGAWAYAKGGWLLASRIGLALPLIALARFVFRAIFRRAGSHSRHTGAA
jgi:predicted MFS family arabinose efflux permease